VGRSQTPGRTGRLPALGRMIYPLVSVLLLIPCFWQSRLQAGDLSSHIYNAWLAQLIAAGQAPGLTIVRQTTNVLFDLMLSGLFAAAGAEAAQRIAVSLAVLIFAWGAFAFVSTVSGRRAWHMLPVIAMLAYGWVFHMGFFSFYLSLGLCFWAMALCWAGKPRRIAAAVPVLAVAWLAHALPVAWTLIVLLYLWLAGRMKPRAHLLLAMGSVLAMLFLCVAVGTWMFTRWFSAQVSKVTGLDQVAVFDDKYWVVVIGLLVIWIGQFRESEIRSLITSPLAQVSLLTALGIFILPNAVLLPGYQHVLAFISERMSLALAICIFALLAAARARPWHRYATALAAAVFFAFLYRDEAVFNSVEDRISRLVSQLPANQRVISAIGAPDLRVNALGHMIDRVCIGKCYSYANYEPSTGQFRIRAAADNSIVISTSVSTWEMQIGSYVTKERDLPLYEVNIDSNHRLVMLSLLPGVPSGATHWNPL